MVQNATLTILTGAMPLGVPALFLSESGVQGEGETVGEGKGCPDKRMTIGQQRRGALGGREVGSKCGKTKVGKGSGGAEMLWLHLGSSGTAAGVFSLRAIENA